MLATFIHCTFTLLVLLYPGVRFYEQKGLQFLPLCTGMETFPVTSIRRHFLAFRLIDKLSLHAEIVSMSISSSSTTSAVYSEACIVRGVVQLLKFSGSTRHPLKQGPQSIAIPALLATTKFLLIG